MAASLPKANKASILTDEPREHSDDSDRVACRIVEGLSVEDLMRGILQKVGLSSQSSQETRETSDPILGVDIDGSHYSLVCSPCADSHHLSPREQEMLAW